MLLMASIPFSFTLYFSLYISATREPEVHAVWSITCLLMATSTNLTIRSLFNVVAQRYSSANLEWLLNILCTVAYSFYHQEV